MANKQLTGLVSVFDAPNYGTVFQAFALQHALKKMGVDSEYITYTPSRVSSLRVKLSKIKKRIKTLFIKKSVITSNGLDDYSFFDSREFKAVKKGYSHFVRKYIKASPQLYNPITISMCKRYTEYMVGSDQTWSESMNVSKDRLFFLNQITSYPKYSYAPSIGSTIISSNHLDYIIRSLLSYRYLSCRERKNCTTLTAALGREVRYVIDPTLLLTPAEWDAISAPNTLCKDGYILCYILGEKESISCFADELGKQKNLPIYYIVTRPKYLNKENCLFPTPEQFISLIRDAAYVVTDSFHGSIFSINFSKNFYSFTKRENCVDRHISDNDRILEILNEFSLTDRFRKDDDSRISDDIDFSKVQRTLDELRKESMSYLSEMTKEILVNI